MNANENQAKAHSLTGRKHRMRIVKMTMAFVFGFVCGCVAAPIIPFVSGYHFAKAKGGVK